MTCASGVAVVIPVFNRRLKLIKTLETVAAQSKLPGLLVVVDDGSTDGTAEAAKDWLARNAPFEWRVLSQANAGVSAARNAGFADIGKLPFVCFLDSDDLWPADFIAEGLRALKGSEALVAAVADKVKYKKGKARPVQSLALVATNPLIWLICSEGGVLSCIVIRSEAARTAGPFVPGLQGEDTDFLFRLFLCGGVAHSKSPPVLFVKGDPLEPSEPRNLSYPNPEHRQSWARGREILLSKLPADVLKTHERLLRTTFAGRWASVAFVARQKRATRIALHGLLRSIWWDYDWKRRLELIWSFAWSRRAVLAKFATPYRERGF